MSYKIIDLRVNIRYLDHHPSPFSLPCENGRGLGHSKWSQASARMKYCAHPFSRGESGDSRNGAVWQAETAILASITFGANANLRFCWSTQQRKQSANSNYLTCVQTHVLKQPSNVFVRVFLEEPGWLRTRMEVTEEAE